MLAFLLSACSSVSQYHPYVGDVVDQNVLAKDETECLAYAQAYRSPLDADSIATAAVQGGARNASGAAINPLVPVAGAASAAGSELLSELGVLSDDKRRVFLRCLDHRGIRSGTYNVMDPNE